MFDLAWATQLVVFVAVVLSAVVIVIGRHGVPRPVFTAGAVLLPLIAIAVAVGWSSRVDERTRSQLAVVAEVPDIDSLGEGFVTSDTCVACHPAQYRSWHDSYHRTMTQPATAQSVIPWTRRADLVSGGRRYTFERIGDEFWVDMIDPEWERDLLDRNVDPWTHPDPPRKRKRIVMTTGSHHMQTYWVGGESDGKLYNFPFIWLNEDERWVPREDVFLRPPTFHPLRATWHDNCVECHATASEGGHEAASDTYDPRVAELGIACEACHGPAAEHIYVNQDPRRRYRYRMSDEPDPTIVNPARLPPSDASEVCGQCHAINVFKGSAFRNGVRYRAGGDLTATRIALRTSDRMMNEKERRDWRTLERHIGLQGDTFIEERLWPDGMVRVSGREYNAMTESACDSIGTLSCLSCHSLHESDPNQQLRRDISSDESCFQCHEGYRDRITEHTFHEVGSTGSECLNCHMPRTVYGLMKAIRSHQIDSPTVASSLETGRPNACNLCHVDRSLGWTAKHLDDWYGQPAPELDTERETISAAVLWLMTGDANQRALIAWHMGWAPVMEISGHQWMVPYLAHLLEDPYSCVRYIAHRSLRRIPGYEDLKYDYLASPDDLARARKRSVARWRSDDDILDRAGPDLLMDERRKLDRQSFSRLNQRRNDRDVDLRE